MVSVRSYVHCLLTSLGYFDDSTGFNIDRIMDQAREIPYLKNVAIERSVFEKCAVRNENDIHAVEWAFKGFQCIMEEIKKEQMVKNVKFVSMK